MAAGNYLKKAMCWSAVFLWIVFIGSASVLRGYQHTSSIHSRHVEMIRLATRDSSNNFRVGSLADRTKNGEYLATAAALRPAVPIGSMKVTAGWYGREHQDRMTASGQRFDINKNTLAHKTLPLGTKVRLINPVNGKSAEGVVNDRGPYSKNRNVDVSFSMAKQLGFLKKGVMKLYMETM